MYDRRVFVRKAAPANPVTLTLDGKRIVAERGEPLAAALLAAGIVRISRSPKLHRPRGPSCLRGDCEGCIARVDGEPNVMTCLRVARGGEEVTAQNTLGSKDTDLLRVTDWFFPKGIDHHHLLTGIPGVSDVMQTFARQMAGIGRLPKVAVATRAATREVCDVLVIGGGIAGASAASAASELGVRVMLIDEGAFSGGSARAYGTSAMRVFEAIDLRGVDVRSQTSAVGVYGSEVLLVPRAGGAIVATARAFVFATGAHDAVLAVPNNDLPGVLSARALLSLDASGIVPRGPVAIVGGGPFAKRFAERPRRARCNRNDRRRARGHRRPLPRSQRSPHRRTHHRGRRRRHRGRGRSELRARARERRRSRSRCSRVRRPNRRRRSRDGPRLRCRRVRWSPVRTESARGPWRRGGRARRGFRHFSAFDERLEEPQTTGDEDRGEETVEQEVVAQIRKRGAIDRGARARDADEDRGRKKR